MKLGLRSVLGLVFVVSLLPTLGHAQTYFEPCNGALAKPQFKTLASYLASKENLLDSRSLNSKPGKCFRLNDHEFVVLPKFDWGIYHCEFKTLGRCALYKDKIGSSWEGPAIDREFTDRSGKHFVLLRQGTLEHGIRSTSFYILYLVPPGPDTDDLPFTIQLLAAFSLNNDTGSLADDPCGKQEPETYPEVPEAAHVIKGVDVGNDQAGRATVTFRMTQLDCDTGKTTNFHRKLDFNGRAFTDVSDDLPKPDIARLIHPHGMAVDDKGNVFVAVPHNHVILKINPQGKLSVLAGGAEGFADGPARSAKFMFPSFLTAAADGAVLVSDAENDAIRRITPAGWVTTMPGSLMPRPGGKGVSSDTKRALNFPQGVTVDHAGNLYVACDDRGIRKVSPAGVVTLLAGGRPGYVDGPGSQAKFQNIGDIVLGPSGILYVSDPANQAIRKVLPDGTASTLIVGDKRFSLSEVPPDDDFFQPHGIAPAADGSVYASSGDAIFKISPAGEASVYAGTDRGFADGPAAAAQFNRPTSLALDHKGNLFVLDEGNEAIRKISTDGHVTTLIARRRSPGGHGR